MHFKRSTFQRMAVVKIVPIGIEHVEGFHAALDLVAREKKYLAWFEAPPIETTRAFVLHNIENKVSQFVALDEDRVVGWCDICKSNRPAFAHTGTLGIGLIPEYRGRGIGRALLLTTLRDAKAQGLERVELAVYRSNHAAKSLYEKIGFKVEGLKRRSVKIDGHYDDDYIMALFFDEVEL